VAKRLGHIQVTGSVNFLDVCPIVTGPAAAVPSRASSKARTDFDNAVRGGA